jgi:hypothetical protein
MDFRIVASVLALVFLLSGCFSSSSSSDGMSDEDRAAAAASASVLSGSLSGSPDDDDDDDDGAAGGNSLMQQFSRASTMAHCDSGSHTEGTASAESRFIDDGTIGVEWDYYQDCVTAAGTEWESYTDGYSASGWTEDFSVMYSRWASDPEASLDNLGYFTQESAWGHWRFSGEMHTCDRCGEFYSANEMYVRWEIDGGDVEAVIGWGRPDDFLVATGNIVGDNMLEQTIDGYMMMSVENTPCDVEVVYTTRDPLVFEGYGTAGERIASGRLSIELVGSGTFDAEYIDGQLYINGNPVDIEDQDDPCDIDLM